MTTDVVVSTHYLTVKLLSVILTETHLAVARKKESVAQQQTIVPVWDVLITEK